EAASKLCRRYHSLTGQPERKLLISRLGSYHGMGAFGTSLSGADVYREGIDAPVQGIVHVRWDSADALRDAIESAGAENVAACFVEPVIGAGGLFAAP